VLWAARIVLVLVVLLAILTLIGWPFGITLWAWVKLLIVPAVLAIGGYLFNSAQSRATQAAAERRAQDEALQAYLDQMSQLLTDKELPLHSAQPGDSLSAVARARTLTVLGRLDGGRKSSVLQFLYESGLIKRGHNIVDLKQADLSEVKLSDADLSGANLSEARGWTEEQLTAAKSLEGATMPNGQKYEEWLKSKGRKEDGQNGGSP
jgi:hypothetical protein